MDGLTGLVLSLTVLLETNLSVHAQAIEGGSGLDEGPDGRQGEGGDDYCEVRNTAMLHKKKPSPVKKISIVGHKDVWFSFLNVIKPSLEKSRLQPEPNCHILWNAVIKHST